MHGVGPLAVCGGLALGRGVRADLDRRETPHRRAAITDKYHLIFQSTTQSRLLRYA